MSETLRVEMIDPKTAPPSNEEAVAAVDSEMSEFNSFFQKALEQNPPDPYERAYLKTYLMYKLIGPERMVKARG